MAMQMLVSAQLTFLAYQPTVWMVLPTSVGVVNATPKGRFVKLLSQVILDSATSTKEAKRYGGCAACRG